MFDDIKAVFDRDPAARGFWGVFEIVLSYSGYHALKAHRLAHFLWKLHVPVVPRLLSQLARFITGVEIHPGATIGKRFFIDHGMGVVIGETTEIGDDVTLFQGVTLGGTGKERGKRHPTLGNGVVVGVGAAILGNITIGDNSYIGAGAVVLKDVPPDSTAVGVPARIVKLAGRKILGATLDHVSLPDPVLERMQELQDAIETAHQVYGDVAFIGREHLVIKADSPPSAARQLEDKLTDDDVSYRIGRLPDGGYHIDAAMCQHEFARVISFLNSLQGLDVHYEEEVFDFAALRDEQCECSSKKILRVAARIEQMAAPREEALVGGSGI